MSVFLKYAKDNASSNGVAESFDKSGSTEFDMRFERFEYGIVTIDDTVLEEVLLCALLSCMGTRSLGRTCAAPDVVLYEDSAPADTEFTMEVWCSPLVLLSPIEEALCDRV